MQNDRPQIYNSPTQNQFLERVLDDLCQSYSDGKALNHRDGSHLPSRTEVIQIIQSMLELLFPGYSNSQYCTPENLRHATGNLLAILHESLMMIIERCFRESLNKKLKEPQKSEHIYEKTEQSCQIFLQSLPELRNILKLDIEAAYAGDPAAQSFKEILISYPGLFAIAIQRLAHILQHQQVPVLPRIMTEYAHSVTGIDIHPGAHLGKGIFIDHGTGVVIGETTIIGDNVKIYQGVTLGALSFPKDACGKLIRGTKRHPTIENDVTLYAGATVLGNITIGEGSIIGGNVWLTNSLPPFSKVSIQPPSLSVSPCKTHSI